MGKIILITGGARSGKSSYAEEKAKKIGSKVMYIATAVPFDSEMKDRIRKHQIRRPENWVTYEGYENLYKIIDEVGQNYQCVILDCVTVMITNIMFNYPGFSVNKLDFSIINKIEEHIMNQIYKLMEKAKEKNITLLMVTNEVGSGIVPNSKVGRVFRDIAGRVNQVTAKQAQEVYFLVSGLPMKIK